jgi:NDP-sugar pyrophosphorylase family protein
MQHSITQAVLLSAGLGTRARALTEEMNVPKVMLPLLGKPLLEWHIEKLKKCGISEFFINLHYLPGAIRDYFGDGSRWDVNITYALEEPEILGTAGGIKNFERTLGEHFFVLYGDTFYEVDYGNVINFYFSKKDTIGIGTARHTDHPEDSDLAVLDADSKVIQFFLKPHKEFPKDCWGMSAPYIFSKKILEYIPPKTYYEIDHQLLPHLLSLGCHYYAYQLQRGEFRKDIGTPERYREAEEHLKGK